MAVQEQELIRPIPEGKPQLHLVEPPPPRGRPVAAAALVIMLAGLLGLPAADAFLDGPPAVPRFEARSVPAARLGELPPLPAVPESARPRTPRPFAGIAFVRCTRLWTALPDGSHERRIVAMTGIASPTFSHDASTIAFLKDGRELWMVGARGENPTKVGAVAPDDLPREAFVTGLSWSPTRDLIALAVVTPTYGPTIDGSAIYLLDLATGELERVGAGSPPISWQGNKPVYVQRVGDDLDVRFAHRSGRNLSSEEDDLGAVAASWWWSGVNRHGVAILRRLPSGRMEILVRRNTWSPAVHLKAKAPRGYSLNPKGTLAMSQDASRVFAELIDDRGEADVGVLDTGSGAWKVLDYAWDPATSPAPVARQLGSDRAASAAQDLLMYWRWRPRRAELLTGGALESKVLPFKLFGYTLGDPVRTEDGWRMEATAFGRADGVPRYRSLWVSATSDRERLTLDLSAASPVRTVTTVADAIEFVREAVGRDVPAPTWLPPEARITRNSLNAWSWGGKTNASIYLGLGQGKHRPGKYLTLSYGDVSFSLGCGGTNNPRDEDVAGTAAAFDHVGRTRQVIWPATVERQGTAFLSVHGDVPKETIMRVAASIEAAR